MSVLFRATEQFMASVRHDLMRPHRFAHERVGFVTVKVAAGAENLVLLAQDYFPVADSEYVDDPTFGAMIGQEALRKALDLALLNPVGVFHVHMHLLSQQRLWFSAIDLSEQRNFVPDFFKVRPTMPHGALVLSPQSAAGLVWRNASDVQPISEFNTVGAQLKIIAAALDGSTDYSG